MAYDAMLEALKSNPDLARKIGAAQTPEERKAIFDDHGVPTPAADTPLPTEEMVRSIDQVAGGTSCTYVDCAVSAST